MCTIIDGISRSQCGRNTTYKTGFKLPITCEGLIPAIHQGPKGHLLKRFRRYNTNKTIYTIYTILYTLTHLFYKLGYDSDTDEVYTNDISQCYKTIPAANGNPEKIIATNGAGRRSEKILSKKKQKFRLKLFTPLSTFTTLIPSGIPVGIKLYLTSGKLYNNYATMQQLCNYATMQFFYFFSR